MGDLGWAGVEEVDFGKSSPLVVSKIPLGDDHEGAAAEREGDALRALLEDDILMEFMLQDIDEEERRRQGGQCRQDQTPQGVKKDGASGGGQEYGGGIQQALPCGHQPKRKNGQRDDGEAAGMLEMSPPMKGAAADRGGGGTQLCAVKVAVGSSPRESKREADERCLVVASKNPVSNRLEEVVPRSLVLVGCDGAPGSSGVRIEEGLWALGKVKGCLKRSLGMSWSVFAKIVAITYADGQTGDKTEEWQWGHQVAEDFRWLATTTDVSHAIGTISGHYFRKGAG